MQKQQTLQRSQETDQETGLQFELDKDSVQIACTMCAGEKHSIFHCTSFGPQSLIVFEPILAEVFLVKDAFDSTVDLTYIRETIASACHMLSTKITLTTPFLEPLDDSTKLQELAHMYPIATRFPKVIYVLVRKLADSVARKLISHKNLQASLRESKRALILIPHLVDDLSTLHESPAKLVLSSKGRLTKDAVVHAITEIECVFLDLLGHSPAIDELVCSIQSQLDRLIQPTPSKPSLKLYAEPWVPSSRPPPFHQTLLPPPSSQDLRNVPPYHGPHLTIDQVFNQTQQQTESKQLHKGLPKRKLDPNPPHNLPQGDSHVELNDNAKAEAPVLSSTELFEKLRQCSDFPSDYSLQSLIERPSMLLKGACYIGTVYSAQRRELLIQVARHQMYKVRTLYEQKLSECILYTLRLCTFMVNHTATPLEYDHWLKMKQLIAPYQSAAGDVIYRRAALQNFVGLSPDMKVPLTTRTVNFAHFKSLISLTISLGLSESSEEWIEFTLTVLHAAKRSATKWSVFELLKSSGDLRALEKEPDVHSNTSDYLLEGYLVCTCLPRLYVEFMSVWLKATGVKQGSICSAVASSHHSICPSNFCMRTRMASSYLEANCEVLFFIDLFTRIVNVRKASTREELRHSKELNQLLTTYQAKR